MPLGMFFGDLYECWQIFSSSKGEETWIVRYSPDLESRPVTSEEIPPRQLKLEDHGDLYTHLKKD